MFSYDFMQNAFFVAICISLLCPCIGIFMVLRRSSMIGDTMSHASLAGITLGLLTNTNPILGAFIFTASCGALIEFLRKYFSHHLDLILTIILSLSIGTAITLISSGKLKANANVFFFGSILTVNTTDMISIAALTILSVKVDFINYIFAILMAAAVSISIKIVGVLVLSAMIALPVASALQLEKGFRTTLLCSIGFSLLAMIIGLFGSYYLNVAPGGFVSLTSVAILLVVLVIKNIRTILRRMQFSK